MGRRPSGLAGPRQAPSMAPNCHSPCSPYAHVLALFPTCQRPSCPLSGSSPAKENVCAVRAMATRPPQPHPSCVIRLQKPSWACA